jgi:hexokinase
MAGQVVADLRERCATPASLLRELAAEMADEMRAGLEKEGGSRVKMLLSYVDKLPTGLVHILALLFLRTYILAFL